MACGCTESSCACVLQGSGTVTVSGAGTVANPYIIASSASPTFAATNPLGGILITPGGVLGHAPALDLALDPASPAALSVSGAGLSVACCGDVVAPPLAIVDDDTTLDDTYYTVLVDNSFGPVTIILDATPTVSQRFEIKDYGSGGAGNATANNITVDGNGLNIDGLGTDYIINSDGDSSTFVADGVGGYAVL